MVVILTILTTLNGPQQAPQNNTKKTGRPGVFGIPHTGGFSEYYYAEIWVVGIFWRTQ